MERLLPDLDGNVKCGNSVINTDYSTGQLDFGERNDTSTNPFDWDSEFKSIMESGAFHAIIGNPSAACPQYEPTRTALAHLGDRLGSALD